MCFRHSHLVVYIVPYNTKLSVHNYSTNIKFFISDSLCKAANPPMCLSPNCFCTTIRQSFLPPVNTIIMSGCLVWVTQYIKVLCMGEPLANKFIYRSHILNVQFTCIMFQHAQWHTIPMNISSDNWLSWPRAHAESNCSDISVQLPVLTQNTPPPPPVFIKPMTLLEIGNNSQLGGAG